MKIRTVGRCIGEGFKSVFRNGLMSIASIGTITACLIILGIVYCLVANVQSFAGGLDSKIGMVAFLKNGITQEEVDLLTSQLDQREDIASYHYVSADEAWETFKKEMLGGDEINEALMEELNEDNPLANSANIEIYPANAESQDNIVAFLNASPMVRTVRYSANASKTLASIGRLVTYTGVALIAFLIFIAVLLISNTIRLSVYTRRTEINIMKYIGATDSFIRLPFVVEGMLIGILGAILPSALIYFGYNSLIKLLMTHFSAISSLISIVSVYDIIKGLLPIFLVLSIVVGVFGSTISIRRHLRV